MKLHSCGWAHEERKGVHRLSKPDFPRRFNPPCESDPILPPSAHDHTFSKSLSGNTRQLHALMGSNNAHEAEVARNKLTQLLAEHKLTWNDLPEIFASNSADTHCRPSPSRQDPVDPPMVNVLDLVLRLLEDHIAVTSAERIAIGLWVLHTHVYNRYGITPRLALLSPVRGCGKTTALELLISQRPHHFVPTTSLPPRSITHLIGVVAIAC